MRVVAGLIGHPRARQASARSDETVDAPPRPLTPADIEGGKLREELRLAVGRWSWIHHAIARQSTSAA